MQQRPPKKGPIVASMMRRFAATVFSFAACLWILAIAFVIFKYFLYFAILFGASTLSILLFFWSFTFEEDSEELL